MSGNTSLDSGVGARVFGTMLTWMQEKKSKVFVYATANDVSALPPELLRKGRFDEVFSVALPTLKERKEIFEIHIRSKGREKLLNSKLDLDELARMTPGFSGAEIESVIESALFSAFAADKDLNMVDISEAVEHTTPLSVTMSERIKFLEDWCKTRTRPASEVEEEKVKVQGRKVQA